MVKVWPLICFRFLFNRWLLQLLVWRKWSVCSIYKICPLKIVRQSFGNIHISNNYISRMHVIARTSWITLYILYIKMHNMWIVYLEVVQSIIFDGYFINIFLNRMDCNILKINSSGWLFFAARAFEFIFLN